MTVEDTIERVARAIWEVLYDEPPEMDGVLSMTRHGLSSLRPGDKLPNGLVVVRDTFEEIAAEVIAAANEEKAD